MPRSMTAYGRADAETDLGFLVIEIHSVNRKNLDIHFHLPEELLMFDMLLRRRLTEDVRRGYVSVRITKEGTKSILTELPDKKIVRELHAVWERYACDLGYDLKKAIPFTFLLNYALTNVPVKRTLGDSFKNQLYKGFEKALISFLEMKEREGETLLKDLCFRLDIIEKSLGKIEGLVDNAPQRYYDKLIKRLQELKISCEGDEERLAREQLFFAEKVDITEEITRVKSHVKQFKETLFSNRIRMGKELDFLIQEMNREVNTMAAKSQELEVIQIILLIKGEQGKIREQLQNIE